jgi:hypothetical protein
MRAGELKDARMERSHVNDFIHVFIMKKASYMYMFLGYFF